MTELLKKAFEKAAQELPVAEQDALGAHILTLIESDDRLWDQAFAQSADTLSGLADQALRDFHEGRTAPLDPETL